MQLASEHGVVEFTLSSCYMCRAVRLMMAELSVNARVHELDSDPRGKDMERALLKMLGGGRDPAVPAVFISGKLVGGIVSVMSLHLAGELVPMLVKSGMFLE